MRKRNLPPETCATCGVTFIPHQKGNRTCSRVCSIRYQRVKANETRLKNSIPCKQPGCQRWIQKRHHRHYCVTHIRHHRLEHTLPIVDNPKEFLDPRPPKYAVFGNGQPARCPKCGGCVGPQEGMLLNDSGYELTFFCINCGTNGHQDITNLPIICSSDQLRRQVQALATQI